ncbi:MAG: hypothetical protein HQK99_17595 [Nitrospirae bacterium]|nr:hypothetical protein [Nitrospirota bacterium]
MKLHVIQQSKKQLKALLRLLKQLKYIARGYVQVADAYGKINVGDLIVLDYSLIINSIDEALQKLTLSETDGIPKTRIIIFTGQPDKADNLKHRKEVFRVIGKEMAIGTILNTIRVAQNIESLQSYVTKEFDKAGDLQQTFLELEIPILILDISYRVIYFNNAVRYIYPNIEKGSLCFKCADSSKKIPCSACIVEDIYNNNKGRANKLHLLFINGKSSYHQIHAIAIKNDSKETYATLLYCVKDTSADLVTYDYEERIKSILQSIIQKGFTRARYFEVEHLPICDLEEDCTHPHNWLMTAKAEMGGGVTEDFIGTRKPFNFNKSSEASQSGIHYTIEEVIPENSKSLWSKEVQMGKARNWAKIIIYKEANGEDKPVVIIELDKRNDHIGKDRPFMDSKINTAAQIEENELDILKPYFDLIKKVIIEELENRDQKRRIKDAEIIIKAENEIATAKTEKDALKILLEACANITTATCSNLMKLSQDEKSIELMAGQQFSVKTKEVLVIRIVY